MTSSGLPEFDRLLSVAPHRVWMAWISQVRVDRRLDVIDAAIALGRWRPGAALRYAEPVQVTLSEYPKYDGRQFTVQALVTLTVPTGLHVQFGLKRGPLSIWNEPAVIVEEYVVRYATMPELLQGISKEVEDLRQTATRRTLGE
jgi:hypothetical protein